MVVLGGTNRNGRVVKVYGRDPRHSRVQLLVISFIKVRGRHWVRSPETLRFDGVE